MTLKEAETIATQETYCTAHARGKLLGSVHSFTNRDGRQVHLYTIEYYKATGNINDSTQYRKQFLSVVDFRTKPYAKQGDFIEVSGVISKTIRQEKKDGKPTGRWFHDITITTD